MHKVKDRSASFIERKIVSAAYPLKNIRTIVEAVDDFHHDKCAFKEICNKEIVARTYGQFANDVYALGTQLMAMGAENHHAAIIGENAYAWVISYFAMVNLGVAAPIDKELTLEDMKKLVAFSDSEFIFASTKYAKSVREIMDTNDEVKKIIFWGKDIELFENECRIEDLIEKGKILLEQGDRSFTHRDIDENDLATIIFTSGTTGSNKGVMLTHKNICANVTSIIETFPIEFVSLSVLPMNHAYELHCHILPAIFFGMEICISGGLKRLIKDFQTFKPGMVLVVPVFIDELYSLIWLNAKNRGFEEKLKRGLHLSKALLLMGIDIRQRIFKEVHEVLGGNLSLLVCGGAPINATSALGMSDLGFDILNGFGITECSPLVAVNLQGSHKIASVGPAVPGVHVKIDNPNQNGVGEILVCGDSTTIGYYKDPEANKVSFTEEGWYKTGDYGRIDHKGRIWPVGRKKNLIILANGKNVHPEEIEKAIVEKLPYVREVIVYDAKRTLHGKLHHDITAAISIKPETDVGEMPEEQRREYVLNDIRKINKTLAVYKRMTLITITLNEFKKNAAKKIVRHKFTNKNEFITVK